MPRALILEDDERSRRALVELVEGLDFEVEEAATLADGRELLQEGVDVLLSDLRLPDGDGIELVQAARDLQVTSVVITGQATVDSAIGALRLGALDYFQKPIDTDRLKRILGEVLEKAMLRKEVKSLRGRLREFGRFGALVGASRRMQEVYDLIETVAPTAATVLITGESGTGKEVVASTLHQLSPRGRRPFEAVNCSAFASGLLESELFGHEKGSFTGASRRHQGMLERAEGGTLFLDEITEMAPELQAKFLRVLESNTYRRVGGERSLDSDVRIVAATNRKPKEAVEAGKLREDLFYRLDVFPIELPPLRDREGDVALLAQSFLDGLNREHGTETVLSEAAQEALADYSWPGNVRELKNVVARAHLLADTVVEIGDLPTRLTGRQEPEGPNLTVRVGTSIAEVERRLLLATLVECGGNKSQTAEVLGISVKTLYNRLRAMKEEDEEAAAGDEKGSDSEE